MFFTSLYRNPNKSSKSKKKQDGSERKTATAFSTRHGISLAPIKDNRKDGSFDRITRDSIVIFHGNRAGSALQGIATEHIKLFVVRPRPLTAFTSLRHRSCPQKYIKTSETIKHPSSLTTSPRGSPTASSDHHSGVRLLTTLD